MKKKTFSVAIDGPAGAGKSTLARAAAKELGFYYVDTGAIYRSVGLAAHRRGLDTKDETAVSAMLPEINPTSIFMAQRSRLEIIPTIPASLP